MRSCSHHPMSSSHWKVSTWPEGKLLTTNTLFQLSSREAPRLWSSPCECLCVRRVCPQHVSVPAHSCLWAQEPERERGAGAENLTAASHCADERHTQCSQLKLFLAVDGDDSRRENWAVLGVQYCFFRCCLSFSPQLGRNWMISDLFGKVERHLMLFLFGRILSLRRWDGGKKSF